MADDIVYDEILGELRTSDVSGGTGGSSFNPVGGAGITVAGGTFALVTADADDVLNGTANTEAVDVKALRGALTAGQAVDVTSQPDGVTGDYRGTFTVTGTLGFASFPKYANGLNYLMIADLTATTSGTVTPSGTWLDGTSAAKSLAAGTSTRVAMLFNAANKAKLTFASTGSVSVTNCREYEVTACSTEAIAYIAALSNQDAFASYYLVKADMVQPWTYIIDMGSSPAVTIASGLSYKLNAATGTHTLTVDTCPAGYDGRDAIIRITLGGSGVIQAVSPLQLGGALVPYAINNCVVRFRDGEAVLLVEDTLAGYVVTVNSGTGEGSLPYGLAAADVPYIAFSPSTDGTPVDLSGATSAEEVTVVGNGYTSTTLTGAITCTSKTLFANLAMSSVSVLSGTMTLGDVRIPSGATVTVRGGRLAVERVTGDSGTIDLGASRITVGSGQTAVASGISFVSGGVSSSSPGAFLVTSGGSMTLIDCDISNNTASYAAAMALNGLTEVVLSGCSIHDNLAAQIAGIAIGLNAAPIVVRDCEFGDLQNIVFLQTSTQNSVTLGGSMTMLNRIYPRTTSFPGTVTIESGAVIDLTGNSNAKPIVPGGAITIPAGAVVTIIGSDGPTSSAYLSELALTGSTITNAPAVLGATVTIPANGETYEVHFSDGTSSTYTGGETERQEVLDGAVVYIGGQ